MNSTGKKLKIAIIGSGNIGTDLLIKAIHSEYLECSLFIGRDFKSAGLAKAISLGIKVSDRSIKAIEENPDVCDLVFDATSAKNHEAHWDILKKLGKPVIDMTPAKLGAICVPSENLQEASLSDNINMITCGGQASIPIACAIRRAHASEQLDYVEVVSSIASRSAGPATRANIDEYVETTEKAICQFSGSKKSKAILILNPAVPCIDMQTSVTVKLEKVNLELLKKEVDATIAKIQKYVPGYSLLLPPTFENGRVIVTVKVQGNGDYLPKYAGNLDIINCAAISVAEEFSKRKFGV
ncbi:acetaldehyde dehydrogenase (acetylating) [Leptospira ilyithenensis]|uniref:Acetaldehyde dehydrogenase n=1 Tax=Leptospira ilyithenensis TaxID=2484901 RepID=A0A4V3JWW3_9LEPT|nr:acetaldehyde dehydrogenase (acetylating) [Leptospira ilyithenensis]TGN08028.1 acetaldehyde dehydrogenase (acetylating) [Leptospira ilyithenensis]